MQVSPLAHMFVLSLIDLTEEGGSALKKRSSDYLLTHGKPNGPPQALHDSNQNRFRIYFESPPELDRVPKVARRNPNKRWRRETSSVAPSRAEDGRDETATVKGDERVEEGLETATIDEALDEGGEDETVVDGAGSGTPVQGVNGSEYAEEEEQLQEAAETEEVVGSTAREIGTALESTAPVAAAVAANIGEVTASAPGDPTVGAPTPALDKPDEVRFSTPMEDQSAADAEEPNVDLAYPTAELNETVEHDGASSHMPQVISNGDSEPDFSVNATILSETVAAESTSGPQTAVPEAQPANGVTGDEIVEIADAGQATAVLGKHVGETANHGNGTSPVPESPVPQGDSDKPEAKHGDESTPIPEEGTPHPITGAEATAAALEAAFAKSAENTASAYKSRGRRRSSVSSTDSQEEVSNSPAVGVPSTNRLSILYEDSSKRLCFDASTVDKVRIFREEAEIEVVFASLSGEQKAAVEDAPPVKEENGDEKGQVESTGATLPRGVLVSSIC